MSAALRDYVRAECVEALKRHGFIEIRKTWPIKYINDDFRCWVGLNFGVYGGTVSLSPFIGVHGEKLDRLAAVLAGRKYDGRCASYAVHMGEIAPHEPTFEFFDRADTSGKIERLATLYAQSGFQFSQDIASYAALLPLLHERTPMLGGFPERYAICLLKLGRREEAIGYVTRLAEDQEHLTAFCENFVRHCETEAQ